MYEDTMDSVKPCVMPIWIPMKVHAANMPAGEAEMGAERSVLATRSIMKPTPSSEFLTATLLPFAMRPTVRAVRVVASIVADASIGSMTLGTAHCKTAVK